MKGTVIRLFKDKRYGFILGSDQKEYFFHHDECKEIWDELDEQDLVEFEANDSYFKGPRATGVAFGV